MSGSAARMWARMTTIGRDSLTFGRALFQAVRPIITQHRHQDTTHPLTVGDAMRNVLVSQARESNRVATGLLSWQQQIGLLQYHGVVGYWRQRQGLLQSTTSAAGINNVIVGNTDTTTIRTSSNQSNIGSVAKVAFMITASMRKELSERLKYTVEDIKAMTPVEASLILHHNVTPNQKDERLPSLLQAHEEELERQRQQQERERILLQEEEEERNRFLLAQQHENQKKEALEISGSVNFDSTDSTSAVSQMNAPIEGLYASKGSSEKLQSSEEVAAKQPDSSPTLDYSLEIPTMDSLGNKQGMGPSIGSDHESQPALGTFAASMQVTADRKKEWYEIVETRTSDNSSTPVCLFADKEEAEMAMDLKKTFAERSAKEDHRNLENIPVTTYSIQKIIK